MDSPTDFIAKLYRPSIEKLFADHPQRDVIMRSYDRGDASPEQWDLWFAEADAIGWERLKALGDRFARGEITFTYVKKDET